MVQIPLVSAYGESRTAIDSDNPLGIEIINSEIIDPTTGEVIDPANADSLIDAYERIKEKNDICYSVLLSIRHAMASLTVGDAKTRRIQGKRRKAKLEMPSDSWEQAKLREAWNEYPDLRDQVLKIDTIGVRMTEYKKLVNTAGDATVEEFRDVITSANRGPTGSPTVKIEV